MDLLNQMGFSDGASCESLPVGGNNRLWKVAFGGQNYALKQYFRNEGGRDRMNSEIRFLDYANMLGIRSVPGIVHKEPEEGAILFDWVDGQKPTVANANMVDQAMDFFEALQGGHGFGGELLIGAEACFSVDHHLACIDQRMRLLERIPLEEDVDGKAIALVKEQILPVWNSVRARVQDAIPASSMCDKCVSPSDFGFHNAISKADGRLSFLDFEYAGWDDPAKMVCDFFCQPAVPVSQSYMDVVLGRVLPLFAGDTLLQKRIELLLPAYQLKWCAICLNEFLPERRKTREFAGRSLSKLEQLNKAAALVQRAGQAA